MFLISEDFWEVRKTENRGLGVFAKKEIAKGTIISDYLGKVIKYIDFDLELDKHGLYLMYYSDEFGIYPDLTKPGPHLINHTCEPNCWIYVYRGHTLFYALRDIKVNEEITINYLLSPDDTHLCLCGSKNCTGFMHPSRTSRVESKARRAKVIVGENLAPLKTYPVLKS